MSERAHLSEWMAPDDVVKRVRRDYLEAIEWLNQVERDGRTAQQYISGTLLASVAHHAWTRADAPLFAGAMRSDHHVQVRRFSEDGESCLVIDHQTQRRMATYHIGTGQRAATQDLGDAVLVYRMIYDPTPARWKIAAFVQQLPRAWSRRGSRTAPPVLVEVNALPPSDSFGRDS